MANTPKTVSELGEFRLIAELAKIVGAPQKTLIGIGDDCAVLPLSYLFPGTKNDDIRSLVISTDAMVEDVHFRKESSPPEALGHKLAASTLSDIAAMGARASAVLICRELPASTPLEFVRALYRGVSQLTADFGVEVLGGDTVRADKLSFCMTALGVCEYAPLLRANVRPGDDIWVSGEIGCSAAGLHILEGQIGSSVEGADKLISAHKTPIPRLALGEELASRGLAHGLIDISDGLLQDATHLAAASNVTLELEIERVPVPASVTGCGLDLAQALCGGEDYELLFSASSDVRSNLAELSNGNARLPALSRIGTVSKERGPHPVLICDQCQRLSQSEWLLSYGKQGGYTHF